MCTAYHHDGFRYTFTYQQSYDHLELDTIWNIQYDSHCNSVAFRNSILYLLQDEYLFIICICKYTYVYIYHYIYISIPMHFTLLWRGILNPIQSHKNKKNSILGHSSHIKLVNSIEITIQWEFQDPKMEGLYHMGIFSRDIPWNLGLKNMPYMLGTSNLGSWNGRWYGSIDVIGCKPPYHGDIMTVRVIHYHHDIKMI
jgi:hypothetical protein